ncbi:hypothetical protein L6452_02146 [Arctium lappa]|uniref:Uncharacterized protein n=1 Tax=Arctium lappa TaxID=4217 RepID=A0ACB9FK38_ARCLA|nr:hypothetical protein L6452_02146 [Arctium lappa]
MGRGAGDLYPTGRSRGRSQNATASSSATPSGVRSSIARGSRGRGRGVGEGANLILEEDPEEEQEANTQKERLVNNSQTTERVEASIRDMDDSPKEREKEPLATGGTYEKREYQVKEKTCSFKTVNDTRPKEFRGTKGPVALMNWMTKMQSCFKICKGLEELKVTCAATTLLDSALHWWETECAIQGEEGVATLTWEKMKNMMMDKYCTQSEVKKLESEFLRLEQGSLSVQEYVNKFLEKARFASYQVATEQRKVDRFKDGLMIKIKQYVDMTKPTTFVQAVEMETVAKENNAKATGERRDFMRKWEGSNKVVKKVREKQTSTKNQNDGFSIPTCKMCNKKHGGEYRAESVTCYHCGKPGHTVRECP